MNRIWDGCATFLSKKPGFGVDRALAICSNIIKKAKCDPGVSFESVLSFKRGKGSGSDYEFSRDVGKIYLFILFWSIWK